MYFKGFCQHAIIVIKTWVYGFAQEESTHGCRIHIDFVKTIILPVLPNYFQCTLIGCMSWSAHVLSWSSLTYYTKEKIFRRTRASRKNLRRVDTNLSSVIRNAEAQMHSNPQVNPRSPDLCLLPLMSLSIASDIKICLDSTPTCTYTIKPSSSGKHLHTSCTSFPLCLHSTTPLLPTLAPQLNIANS